MLCSFLGLLLASLLTISPARAAVARARMRVSFMLTSVYGIAVFEKVHSCLRSKATLQWRREELRGSMWGCAKRRCGPKPYAGTSGTSLAISVQNSFLIPTPLLPHQEPASSTSTSSTSSAFWAFWPSMLSSTMPRELDTCRVILPTLRGSSHGNVYTALQLSHH
jgi:hypothetical protein